MNFEDIGIVMSVRRHGESSGILELITKSHGRHLGLVRGYQSKSNKSILQPGSTINFNWRSRLSEHLGVFTFELHTSRSLNLMKNKFAILVLQNLISHLRLLPKEKMSQKFIAKLNNYLISPTKILSSLKVLSCGN